MTKRNIKRELIRVLAETIGPHYTDESIESDHVTGDLYLQSDGLIDDDVDLMILLDELKLVYINYMEKECL